MYILPVYSIYTGLGLDSVLPSLSLGLIFQPLKVVSFWSWYTLALVWTWSWVRLSWLQHCFFVRREIRNNFSTTISFFNNRKNFRSSRSWSSWKKVKEQKNWTSILKLRTFCFRWGFLNSKGQSNSEGWKRDGKHLQLPNRSSCFSLSFFIDFSYLMNRKYAKIIVYRNAFLHS